MAAERSTKQQIQAYRAGVRRVQHALETGVSYRRNLHGPRFGLSMIIGLVLGSLILAGFAVYGLIRPAPEVGDATVLIDTDAGGAFVVRDGVAHPATNIASAMLAGAPQPEGESAEDGESAEGGVTPEVARINTDTLADLPRGPMLGIVGAPNQMPTEELLSRSVWQVCDVLNADDAATSGTFPTLRTTVVLGNAGLSPAAAEAAFVVTTEEGERQLVFEGRRARLDLSDAAMVQALGISEQSSRPISTGLLNAIPEGPEVIRPEIEGAGDAVELGSVEYEVGEVLSVERAAGEPSFLLVLADGVQRVSAVSADVVRASIASDGDFTMISPSEAAGLPETETPIDTSAYPTQRLSTLDPRGAPALCLDWRVSEGDPSWIVFTSDAVPVPDDGQSVPANALAPTPAAVSGGGADEVYVPPGSGVVVSQSATAAPDSETNLVLITDLGVAYPIVSRGALTSLGLGESIDPAPPELVSLLPLGPTLDPVAARQFVGPGPGGAGN